MPGVTTLPNYLILGAQKSGTTSLARWIGTHPDVMMASEKEVHYFSDDQNFARGLGWYARHFEGAEGASAVGEATPEYLYRHEAPRRIEAQLGSIRCVVVLRNPIDRAYSAFLHGQRAGFTSCSFERALAEEDRRLGCGRWGWASLVDRGRYLRQLRRYERRFGREAMHVLLFEDLTGEPERSLAGVFEFLGVDASHHVERLVRYNRARESVLPPRLRAGLTRMDRSPLKLRIVRATSRPAEAPPMAADTRAALVDRFREENRALGTWLGRDLSHWDA